MTAWRRGDLVELGGRLASVVGVEGDLGVPEEHVALWFGESQGERTSEAGVDGLRPVVRTVPSEYCDPALPPDVRH